MILKKGAVREYLDREFDDWRWMKKLRREEVVEAVAEAGGLHRWKREPWVNQLVGYYISICLPRFLFLFDMGTGKTQLMLMRIMHGVRTGTVERALVLVPRLLNIDTWVEAVRTTTHLTAHAVTVESIEGKWDELASPKGHITIIDYQGFMLAMGKKRPRKGKAGMELVRDDKKVEVLRKRYTLLCMDEIHKVKNKDSYWFSVLRKVSASMRYVYGLTGTLFGRDIEEVWAQFFLVDHGETFGENIGIFRSAFMTAQADAWSVKYVPKTGMHRKLNRMLQHRSLRYDEDEVSELPERVSTQKKLTLGFEARQHYLRALDGLISANGKLADLDAQWLRMRQITSGYLKWSDDYGDHKIVFAENPKMEALLDTIEQVEGRSKVVVAYDYTDTAQLITARLTKEKRKFAWIYGGTKDKVGEKRRFLEDPECRVLVMNSEAGGTGVDGLQGVARVLVFFETPTSAITRKQTLKRVHRPGSTERVRIIDLVVVRSVDSGILKGIEEGEDLYRSVVHGGGAANLTDLGL